MENDPGNSGPDEWTGELDEAEQAQVRALLDEESVLTMLAPGEHVWTSRDVAGGDDDGATGSGH